MPSFSSTFTYYSCSALKRYDVKLAWLHTNKFPMRRFIDTFDDVIDTAVAIGTIGRGTASLALRGGVDA